MKGPAIAITLGTILFLIPELDSRSLTSVARASENQLVLRGRILLPDGSPAAKATIRSLDQWSQGEATATADEMGRFELLDDFGFDCRIHATSVDGDHQTAWRVPAMYARTMFAKPVEITLQPSVEHVASVLKGGKPVEGAHVLAVGYGINYRSAMVAGSDGRAILKVPAIERLQYISAWHPEHGVGGKTFGEDETLPRSTVLELLPTANHKIRVVDPAGHAVPGLQLGVSIYSEVTGSIMTRDFAATRMESSSDGTVVVPWLPERFRIDAVVFEDDWQLDDVEQADFESESPETTVTVRAKHPVEGRLVMPPGISAEGLLVQAICHGPAGRSDLTNARAQRDGSFSLSIWSNHGYFLNIVDLEWASDGWTGLILRTDDSEQEVISIPVYPATPVEIRLTRGPSKHPVKEVYVGLSGQQSAEWRDAQGEIRSGSSGIHAWLRTDANGIARAALGNGFFEARVAAGDWEERKAFEVNFDDRRIVQFHRPWESERSVTGRLIVDDVAFTPTAETSVGAWGINPTGVANHPEMVKPNIQPDGTFHVSFDAEEIWLFVHDRKKGLSGIACVGPQEDEVEIPLQKNGTVSGRLVDNEGHPLAGFEMTLSLKTERQIEVPHGDVTHIEFRRGPEISVSDMQRTDSDGRFRFSSVPVEMALLPRIVKPNGQSSRVSQPTELFLRPGEVRDNVTVTFRDRNRTVE